MCKVILLNKEGYDPFINFLKGISIFFVVLTHCLPAQQYLLFSLWGSQAVPLFLLIQVFHAYKKGTPNKMSVSSLKKLYKRIVLPFLILLFVQSLLMLISGHEFIDIIKDAMFSGGIGPGSYYVWIYVQFFFLLWLLKSLFMHVSGGGLLILLTVISEAIEMFCIYTCIPDSLYRLLFFRYFFLIYLGYMWTIRGIALNRTTLFLSILSIFFIIMFNYININFEPFFFKTAWKTFHWICYFYTAHLFIFLLNKSYLILGEKIKYIFCLMGKSSYEIFLLQMFVFTFFQIQWLSFIGNKYIMVMLSVLLTTSLSICPVLFYNHYLRKYKY